MPLALKAPRGARGGIPVRLGSELHLDQDLNTTHYYHQYYSSYRFAQSIISCATSVKLTLGLSIITLHLFASATSVTPSITFLRRRAERCDIRNTEDLAVGRN
jgi:hypothetical protein